MLSRICVMMSVASCISSDTCYESITELSMVNYMIYYVINLNQKLV